MSRTDSTEAVMSTDTKPFIKYARNSKLGKREKGNNLSLTSQLHEIDRIAAFNKLTLRDEPITDEDTSGSTFDRPGWNRVIALLDSGEYGGVVAYDMKRISRGKTAEVLVMVEDVEASECELYDGNGRVSVKDADDEMITTVKAMIARREWRERRRYLKASVRNAIEENGAHLSAPFGYRKSDGKGSKLAPELTEAPTVQRMAELRAGGYSWGLIAAAINETGVMPRPHKRHGEVMQARWVAKTVRQIVMNEVYTGVAFNGSLRHEDAHEAIISPELFARANNRRGVKPIGPTEGYLLSGLVRCAECGYVMVHQQERDRGYYRCRNAQHKDGRCVGCNVNAAELEALVAGTFARDFLDVELRGTVSDGRVLEAEQALEQATAHLGGLLELVGTLGTLSGAEKAIFSGKVSEARTAVKSAEVALRQARAAAAGAELPADLDADTFASMPIVERRHLLSIAYGAVVVRRAAGWREPVAQRVRLFGRDEVPHDSTHLIAFVADL
jgi:DNA invertase Pin-like site-specific DNA recombinase